MGHHRGGRWRAQEERLFEACGCAEHEAEEEASSASQEGRESLYQGAVRLQGKTRLQDCARPSYEEAEGDGELSRWSLDAACYGGSVGDVKDRGRPHDAFCTGA